MTDFEGDGQVVRMIDDGYGSIPVYSVRDDRRDLRAMPLEIVSKVHGAVGFPEMTLFAISSIITDSDQVLPIEVYIKFGALLTFIQENCLAYNSDKAFTPFFKFNMAQPYFKENSSYVEELSEDALVEEFILSDDILELLDEGNLDKITSMDWNDQLKSGLFTSEEDFVEESYANSTNRSNGKWIVKFAYNNNLITHIPGQFSSDPTVCIIPYTNTNVKGVNVKQTYLNGLMQGVDLNYQAGTYVARLMNLPVNVGHLQRIMDIVASEEENEASILDFLQRLISDITIALGGINQITISTDESGLVTFRENVPPRS